MNEYIRAIALLVTGLASGSFINALVWRLHKQSGSKHADNKYSILSGRSMCPNCRHKLSTLDLIPVFSWLFLRGRCRYCHKPISAEYPIVELVTPLLFLSSYIYWPLDFNKEGVFYFVIWLILLVDLIALAIYDIHWLKLPNKLMYPALFLILIQIAVSLIFFNKGFHYIGELALGFLIGGGIFYILFQISDGKWIGGGDVKLGALLGLYLGNWMLAILMIFFASVLGSIYSIPFMATGKMSRKTMIPYGPFLIVATIILRLFGTSITNWLNSKGIV